MMAGLFRHLLLPVAALMPLHAVAAQGVASGLGVRSPASSVKPVDRVRAALQQAGATLCAWMIVRAADFLFEEGNGDFTLQPLGPDINRWPIVLTMESAHLKAGATRLTILTLAPAGTCSGSYQQIITWQQTCAVVKSTIFPSFLGEKPLYRSVRQSELTPGIQLYLMPAGTGCVSVKKELIG